MNAPPRGALQSTPGASVPLAEVEAELSRLWRPGVGGEQPPTRACMSNLMVYCGSPEEAGQIDLELPEIVRVHPARVLLLVSDPDTGERRLAAHVSAYCYLAGQGQKICSEHVMLRAGAGTAAQLPSAVRSLLIGDLPSALWWTPSDQAPPGYGRLFEELAAMSDHVIYDSRGWLDPVGSMLVAADWAGREPPAVVASDLAWRRLEPWRRLIAQALDPAVVPGALAAIGEVSVEHGPHALPKAWNLIGWLADSLGWKLAAGKLSPGVEVVWRFEAGQGPVRVCVRRLEQGEPDLYRVTVGFAASGGARSECFERSGPDRILRRPREVAEPPRVVSAPTPSRATAVARELPYRAGQPAFRRTLACARAMAASLQS